MVDFATPRVFSISRRLNPARCISAALRTLSSLPVTAGLPGLPPFWGTYERNSSASPGAAQLARGKRFCAGVWFGKPAPRNLSLPLFPEPESEAKTNGKNSTADAKGTSNATATAESDQLKADPAHSSAVQGSDSGRAQGEAAGKAGEKDAEKK